jgi:hypothetical protein
MSQAQAIQTVSVDLDTLVDIIRQVVREEVNRIVTGSPDESDVVYLEPGSPLYQDMEEILRRKKEGRIKLYTHEEVWCD